MCNMHQMYGKSSTGKEKILNDVVHGIIELPPYIRQIIDTEPFQRLRNISQLQFSNLVYPSASYSRFEHSIGTFHLASSLMNQIKSQKVTDEFSFDLTEEDIKCVEIAALCHDLGHGPFSHFWENAFSLSKTIKDSDFKPHEKLSVEILIDLLSSTPSTDGICLKHKIGLNDEMIDKISRIILGEYDQEKDSNKKFLFEIVANKDSGLDVDKFDYLCRDSIYFGWSDKNKIHDIKRIMFFLKVVKEKDGKEWRLAIRDREIFHIFDIFYYRHLLHRYGYQHKTAVAIECMLKQSLAKLIDDGKLNELIKEITGVEEIGKLYSKEFISKCCDFHIWNLIDKYSSKTIINIRRRNLYKLYYKLKLVTKISSNDLSTLESLLKKKLKDSSVVVSIVSSSFSLSSEKVNPIYRIPFYKKNTPNVFFMFDSKLNPPPTLLKYINEEFNLLIFTDKEIERESEDDKALSTIIDELCRVDDVDKIKFVKKGLENFVKENFEINNNNDQMKNIERQLKDILGQLNTDENQNERLNEIDDLRKKYKFQRLNY